MDTIQNLISLLKDCPTWVKTAFAVWVLFGVSLLFVLIFLPRSAISEVSSETRTPSSSLSNRDTEPSNQTALQNQITPVTTVPRKPLSKPSEVGEKLQEPSSVPGSTSSSIGLSPDEVFRVLADKSITELQKAQFVRRNKSASVCWSAKVIDIAPAWDRADSDIFVSLEFPKEGSTFPHIVVCIFSHTKEADLAAVRPGCLATVRGNLEFRQTGWSYSSTLHECDLVTFSCEP